MHANDAMRESTMASFDQVLPHIKLRPSEVVSGRLDGKRMADLLPAKAEVALLPALIGSKPCCGNRSVTVNRPPRRR